ncbi:alpha-ketoglutarate-dependent dioxygenase AlkB [Hymenobacter sp. BT770]|uniref:alpha-ketoglutarate-dependent dioxygenase AlkB family protein n=1 Tax=Hymenobacter sp. BT770 TaxID=2886942 RepID=UPI001D1149E1|nr:alpha-ketoglutarate-dependent dioxygenase AlkB [Hymenobacter sp. BT770]MCC3154091.1 alpha-ketoglutarate-dependent dioxygenase AlkB [Hymenobacter sp. BT770]MDO3416235.1 alpha-ketoglutarate-dependent dioxygenase AlkB [Hymenobacter sp. BT770]
MALLPLLLPQADLLFDPAFLPTAEADTLLTQLTAEVTWEQRAIRLFGQEVPQPRLTAWYGDPAARYTYSGLSWEPRPWTPVLLCLRQRIEAATSSTFNSVLLNYYRDGRDSMGWHADDEPELGPAPVIASLSLGATRRFRLRPRAGLAHAPLGLDLHSGSLLLMRGATQRHWQHALPKTARPLGPRLNLTFRWVEAA